VLALSPEQFNAVYRQTPLSRAKRAGLQRNARAVLGYPDLANAASAP